MPPPVEHDHAAEGDWRGGRGAASTERRALNALLELHPTWDVLALDWQEEALGTLPGPWLLVTLGIRSEDGAERWARYQYAIWKRTGAVHGITGTGAVTEDPILEVTSG